MSEINQPSSAVDFIPGTNLVLAASDELAIPLSQLVVDCNKFAMESLKVQNYQECVKHLKTAETHLRQMEVEDDVKFRLTALTLNNLGCYYKK